MSRRGLAEADQFDHTWSVVLDRATAVGATVDLDFVCRTAATRLNALAVAVSVPDGFGAARTTGASGRPGQEMEELQALLCEGPSLEGMHGDGSSLFADLTARETRTRWPSFARAAGELGVVAVHVTPMRVGRTPVGILAVYLDRPGGDGSRSLVEAAAFVAVAELVHSAGIVSARRGIHLTDAILGLRARAFTEGRPLSGVCAEVVLSEASADRPAPRRPHVTPEPSSASSDGAAMAAGLRQRRVVQQALGVLMHSGGLSAPDAYVALSELAADCGLSPHEVAAEVLDRARAEGGIGHPSS